MKRWLVAVGSVGLVVLAVVIVIRVAQSERGDPARCAPPAVALGARCCGVGQQLAAVACSGTPSRCAPGLVAGADGCLPVERRIAVPGGKVEIGPSDWEAHAQTTPRQLAVKSFRIDSHEVTVTRWRDCVAAGRCRATGDGEPGRPVRGVSAAEAERFCAFVGGRLPTGSEWVFASAGEEARRYPWGQTGLVCRRAVFGLVDGPCGHGGDGPDVVGSRPDGCTQSGVCDLSGNLAEWTREGGGRYVARGGSFRSRLAGELKSWSAEELQAAAAHVGFRCAYDQGD